MSRRTVRPTSPPKTRPGKAALDEAPEEPPAPEPSLDAEIKPRPPELPPEPAPDAATTPDIPDRPLRNRDEKPRIRVPKTGGT